MYLTSKNIFIYLIFFQVIKTYFTANKPTIDQWFLRLGQELMDMSNLSGKLESAVFYGEILIKDLMNKQLYIVSLNFDNFKS